MFNKKSLLKNIPNILTIFRIALVPFIIALIFINSSVLYSIKFDVLNLNTNITITYFISGILFVIACLSDFFDGHLARKYDLISDFGKIWDPIADKVLTSSIYICFAIQNLIPFYFVLIMITRDIVVDAYRQMATKKGIVTPANVYGKLKTIFQMISILVIYFVFNNSFESAHLSTNIYFYVVQNLFVILATLMSCFSGVNYVVEINKSIKGVN